jgi:hypothetical protein
LLLTLVASGCAARNLPAVLPTHVQVAAKRWPAVSETDLSHGRSLYRAKCGSCHLLELPLERSPAGWEKSVAEMAPKAKLSEREAEFVLQYLWTLSSAPQG